MSLTLSISAEYDVGREVPTAMLLERQRLLACSEEPERSGGWARAFSWDWW